ncbi:glycosyltransferase [Paeniglutamicibacter sp. Y32M11]|uniref:glycosyltransferase n=1 Tax=Paeniglutamicibacter sp. Y32M11 TaxID=2853258 RepID=UPI001C530768|nr:glycosyltransferase [Paeniglutamicibacter sp. Y32M11]QXQ08935.1 glycosyltransferase [Paeniglutamicibacter sp. Y32M11]
MNHAQLPQGDYYMITMQIADSFGGLTAAMLERAKTFVEIGGVKATILTFDARPSYEVVRERMLREQRITPAVAILNLHESLRSQVPAAGAPVFTSEGSTEGSWDVDDSGQPFCYTVVDQVSGQPATLTFTTPEGVAYLHEERGYNPKGERVSRTFTRYSPHSVESYANAGDLYRAWFDELRSEAATFLIVDSKFSATHFAHYERPGTYKFHVQHGYHSVAAGHAITAALTPQRRPVLTRQERWDGIITLTERNKQDLENRFGPANNRFVVSNIVPRVAELPKYSQRGRKRGVMIARLAPVKDIPLALRIMKRVHDQDPAVTLDIYGGGPDHQALLATRAQLGLDGVVTFHGAVPGAAKHFDTAAFTLMTSKSEMQPLVVMEAMGRGCLPVAHDMRYGPRDLITDGTTGFVVPLRDESAAAQKVLAITSRRFMASRMSKAAWKQAENFGHEAALGQWAAVIASAKANEAGRILPDTLKASAVQLTETGLALGLRIPVRTTLITGDVQDLSYTFLWMNRTSGAQQAIPATRVGDEVLVDNAFPFELDPTKNDEPLDAYLQISGHNLSRRIRVPIDSNHDEIRFNDYTSYRTVNGYWSMKK